jgi:hypothetical protein
MADAVEASGQDVDEESADEQAPSPLTYPSNIRRSSSW